jgi:hypothetical protein
MFFLHAANKAGKTSEAAMRQAGDHQHKRDKRSCCTRTCGARMVLAAAQGDRIHGQLQHWTRRLFCSPIQALTSLRQGPLEDIGRGTAGGSIEGGTEYASSKFGIGCLDNFHPVNRLLTILERVMLRPAPGSASLAHAGGLSRRRSVLGESVRCVHAPLMRSIQTRLCLDWNELTPGDFLNTKVIWNRDAAKLQNRQNHAVRPRFLGNSQFLDSSRAYVITNASE